MATTTEELQEVLARLTPAKKAFTFEEYLAWPGEEKKVEWVDGEIIVMAAASIRHEILVSFLGFILKAYTRRHNLGRVLSANAAVKLSAQRRGREPDVLFLRREKENLLRENYIDGPVDIAVEVVSPESVGRDRGDKFVEYEAAGVLEYWYLDPQRQQAEFYRLGEDGRYYLVPVGADGIFRSHAAEGFWLRVAWLWELPDEFDVLRELGVI